MTDTILHLTEHEKGLLEIAALGQSLIPIGIHADTIQALARRGLLTALDSVNYVITAAGRHAVAMAEADDNQALAKAIHGQLAAGEALKAAAENLVEIIQAKYPRHMWPKALDAASDFMRAKFKVTPNQEVMAAALEAIKDV